MVPLARSALWAVLWQNIQRCHGLFIPIEQFTYGVFILLNNKTLQNYQ
jgi:hypothetical protein